MLLVLLASTQVTQAQSETHPPNRSLPGDATVQSTATPTALTVPTVTVPNGTPVSVPTVTIPQPTATATPKPTPKPKPRRQRHRPVRRHRAPAPAQLWIWAYLTSYCPGTAGWRSSSGLTVFYGMLANDYYRFGTRVYLPVLGITGIVEDRIGAFAMWNQFDVWSPICYSTPTGWFRVAILMK